MTNTNRLGPSLLGIALGLTLTVSASAEEKTITLKDAPAAVQKTIADQLKGGRLKTLSVEAEDGKTEYEAELTGGGGGKDRTIVMDPGGKVLESEVVVELSSLPEAVRTRLRKEAGRGTIATVEKVTTAGVVSYEAMVKEAGEKDREVAVGASGQPLPAKK